MTQSQTAKRRRDVAVVTASATVVWVSLTGAVSRKAAEQERDSGQRDECLTRLDRAFRVFRQTPMANQLGKAPSNHPCTACLACRDAYQPRRASSRRSMATSMKVSLVCTLRS